MGVRDPDELACPECGSTVSEFEASVETGDRTHPLHVPFRCPSCHTDLRIVVSDPRSETTVDVEIDRANR